MKFRHPSKDRLRNWLSGADSDADLEEHIDDCDRCAAVIEALGDDALSVPLSSALAQVLEAPADLSSRLEQQVQERLGGREVFGLMAELFGAGVETGRMLIVEPPRKAESESR